MLYHQDINGCFDSKIGDQGLDPAILDAHHSLSLKEKIGALKEAYEKGTLPFLTLPHRTDDIEALKSISTTFQDCSDVVILGTGGSSLGGQALCALRTSTAPRLHFLDNVDPYSFQQVIESLDLQKTKFMVISKSGETIETIMQFCTCLQLYQTQKLFDPSYFLVITEDKKSTLKNLANKFNIKCLDHDPNLGGRYSVLSLVGLLPAMIAGVDVVKVRKGAASVLETLLNAKSFRDCPPAVGAAVVMTFQYQYRYTDVLMPYMDRLNIFSQWWRQLWAESLGKDGKGRTPVNALGTVDQHSQLQLYLDGPRDKVFTLITTDYRHQGVPLSEDIIGNSYIKGKTLGDLMFAEQQATLQTLMNNNRPVREIKVDQINEESLGALMMHFMLETVFAAHLIYVNPFDQPAVEEGKILARQYLEKS